MMCAPCAYVCAQMCLSTNGEIKGTTCRNQPSPSTMWVLGSLTQVVGLGGKCLDMLAYLVRLLNSVSLLFFGHMLS